MKTYIALFRGINVGGNNILPMHELVAQLENSGLQNLRTYIQTGNVVFQSEEKNASLLSNKIRAAIKKNHGFEPQVVLLELEEMEKAVGSNPFPGSGVRTQDSTSTLSSFGAEGSRLRRS